MAVVGSRARRHGGDSGGSRRRGRDVSGRFGEAIVAATVESGTRWTRGTRAWMRICVRRRRCFAARRRSPRDTSAWRLRARTGEASVRWISTTPRRLRFSASRPTSVPSKDPPSSSSPVAFAARRGRERCAVSAPRRRPRRRRFHPRSSRARSARVAGVVSVEVSAADEGQQFHRRRRRLRIRRRARDARRVARARIRRGRRPRRDPRRRRRRTSDARRADSAPSRQFSRDETAARRCCAPVPRASSGAAALETTFNLVDYSVGAASFVGHAAVAADVCPPARRPAAPKFWRWWNDGRTPSPRAGCRRRRGPRRGCGTRPDVRRTIGGDDERNLLGRRRDGRARLPGETIRHRVQVRVPRRVPMRHPRISRAW